MTAHLLNHLPIELPVRPIRKTLRRPVPAELCRWQVGGREKVTETGQPQVTASREGLLRGCRRGENTPAPRPSRRPAPTRHRAPAFSQKVESAKGATAGRSA